MEMEDLKPNRTTESSPRGENDKENCSLKCMNIEKGKEREYGDMKAEGKLKIVMNDISVLPTTIKVYDNSRDIIRSDEDDVMSK